MRGGSFSYLLKQGIVNVWLNRVMSFASVAILTACLIIIGGAGLLSLNMRDIFKAVENQNEVVVFIEEGASETEIETLGQSLRNMERVSEVVYVSKAEALEEQKDYMGEDGYLLDGLEDDNPLPASYRITLLDIDDMESVRAEVETLSSVDSVSAPTHLAETLSGIESTMLILGGIIIGILVVASIVVIYNTIKLTVFERRREISIMKYVGATNGFIRFPFLVEGLAIGLISAIAAFVIIILVYQSLANMLLGSSVAWISTISANLVDFWDIWYWVALAFAGSGMLIGAIASMSSMKKHLQV
ncbi:MAG: permease-like cell division protein FtsX [Oscillospiraceae bacterium]|nr:permease-like cell division protein FtsX [Oscillospiraceae bacterium]